MRVLIIEDSRFLADSIAKLVALLPEASVIGIAHNRSEALILAKNHAPTIAMLDLRIGSVAGEPPHTDHGLATLTQLMALAVPPRVLVITSLPEQPWMTLSAHAGAVGFVSKDGSAEQILAAVQAVAAGFAVFTPTQLHQFSSQPAQLSPRELEVFILLAEGMSNAAIAKQLNISVGTVRKHVENICISLDAHSRGQAVATGRRIGLIP
jgi:two-component system, NarL family, nitrate/nitrite response regulator NarL